ncbi:hypothetical protein ACLKA6_019793 [Drosophila palustris]
MVPPAKRIREKTSTDLKAGNSSDVLPVKIIELINQRFAEQAELITSNMRGMEDRIMGILNERLTSMGGDMRLLTQRVEQLEREVADFRSLKDQVGQLKSIAESQHSQSIACDLRLHGVPFFQGENVKTLFHSTATS